MAVGRRYCSAYIFKIEWNPVLSAQDFEGIQKGTIPEDIKTEQADISWADAVIVICPVWWTSVPAILKGYIDRVFTSGFAYDTSEIDKESNQQSGMVGLITKSVAYAVFGFSGFAKCDHNNFFAVPTASDNERQEMLTELRQLINKF